MNPVLVKLLSSVYMDQRLPHYAKTLWGTREAKLSVIRIHWTKYLSASMTNKSNPTLKKLLAAPLLNPTREDSYVTESGLQSSICCITHVSATEAVPPNFLNCVNVFG